MTIKTEHISDPELAEILSTDRFARYLGWSNNNQNRAFTLYGLNTALSETLYTPLQMLEIALRNRIHTVLSAQYGEQWFETDRIIKNNQQQNDIQKAKDQLQRSKSSYTPSDMVASLTFGFWGTLLNHRYEGLWRQCLHRIASDNGKSLKRARLADPVSRIRKLRNRIAHHEPIIHWHLPKYHQEILTVTGWLSPAAAAWSNKYSRFPAVYPADGIALNSDFHSYD